MKIMKELAFQYESERDKDKKSAFLSSKREEGLITETIKEFMKSNSERNKQSFGAPDIGTFYISDFSFMKYSSFFFFFSSFFL